MKIPRNKPRASLEEMSNKIMLITYADSMGKNLGELWTILEKHFDGAIGGLHILPFFPSSGDRGFAPTCYDRVDKAFGDIEDVKRLGKRYDLMVDFMVNHISRRSKYFLDFQENKDASPYRDLFIRYGEFWENGEPTPEQIEVIYKRKPADPYYEVTFKNGTKEKVWCTFSDEQIDLNVKTQATKKFIRKNIGRLCKMGARIIRLDAFAYAIKKPGTSCFFIKPEIWKLLGKIKNIGEAHGVSILPEIHEHYSIQKELSRAGYWIYDFALPVLVLHALYSGNGEYLKRWLEISPMTQFTTLDTHDGIGIVDVKDILPDEETEFTKNKMLSEGANLKKIYNSTAYNNLDIYQINTTYYSALGNRDNAYLAARAIQFFAPGIPQVYYVGALAGKNDIELLEKTKNGRDINRHYYSAEEIEREVRRPVVQKLLELMKLRNTHPAFSLGGRIKVELPKPSILVIRRQAESESITLTVDLAACEYTIN
jgi:sucrose phosphorylase